MTQRESFSARVTPGFLMKGTKVLPWVKVFETHHLPFREILWQLFYRRFSFLQGIEAGILISFCFLYLVDIFMCCKPMEEMIRKIVCIAL